MRRSTILLLLLALLSTPSFGGVVFEVETTDHQQSPPRVEMTETYVEGRNLKMGIQPGRSPTASEAIYRGERREMIAVDHQDKSYVVMDEAAIGAIAGQMSAAMAQVQEALKNVPEDQRALVEEMMKKRMPQAHQAPKGPASELRRTEDKATHHGYPCIKYEVFLGGRKTHELWVTPWDKVEGAEEARDVFVDMAGFARELIESFSQASGMPGLGQQATDFTVFSHFEELDGFPVVTREFGEDGSLEDEAVLRSARRRTLDPADFEPPAGYKRRQMMPNG